MSNMFTCHVIFDLCSLASLWWYTPLTHCRWSSCEIAWHNCCIFMQFGMFVVVFMASTFNCMLHISSSLFSLWFCLKIQFAVKRSGPGLYMIVTVYCCILGRIQCILWDSVATSFLKVATSGLCIILTFLKGSSDGTSWTCIISVSPSMLLYLFCALDRLLLANAMGLNMLLSGALSLGTPVRVLVHSRAAVNRIPNASVSWYSS